jgi:hypothetical protein
MSNDIESQPTRLILVRHGESEGSAVARVELGGALIGASRSRVAGRFHCLALDYIL